ncbi:MAG TPA: DUF1501 domain-containing protein [Pirellulales bacterium]|jgi:hypothetical protein|nr:DUF1501 domain-containing protein [Pirellulales bacterium]
MTANASTVFVHTHWTRRRVLSIGGAGFFGLNLPRAFAAEEGRQSAKPRAKAVIFLYQFGGPSHVDTFDMKPGAPEAIRGPLRQIATKVPGVWVCEHLPRVAQVIDKVTLVRSVHHTMKNHNSASYYALTGHSPPTDDIRLRDSLDLFPAYGSVVDRLAPVADGMPTFVAYPHVLRDGAVTPGQHASFLGKAHDPLLVTLDPNAAGFCLPELSLPDKVPLDRLENRRELQRLIDRQSKLLEVSPAARGLDAYYDKALSMLNSPRVGRAFNLAAEPDELRERYGRHTYGQSCLLARRLVEAGVKFVNVYFSDTIGGQSTVRGGWDTHGFNNTRMFPIIEKYHLPMTDQTLPTLLTDLDERGLLDETLVVWMGEFGRTPKINDNVSRDHWPQCYTVLLAGGGVRRGFVYGASDKQAAFPDRDGVRPDDLAATMFQLLGIDPATEVRDTADRPGLIAAGNPIAGLIG